MRDPLFDAQERLALCELFGELGADAPTMLDGWVRSFPNLNEFFVHHEDLRRANGRGPRHPLAPEFEAALWRNVRRGSRYLSRRLAEVGLEIRRAGTEEQVTVRTGDPSIRLTGPPGELLLFVFGRKAAALVEVTGPADAVARVRQAHFGM
jgi:uncharacterized protein (TIGR03085 family)